MPSFQKIVRLKTRGRADMIDITSQVESAVRDSGIQTGIANVAGTGSTLGITTIEYEPGALSDLRRALEMVAPENDNYAHNARWGDHNGFAHLRSALIGTARSYPVQRGGLHTGTWQQIILCDFDDGPRDREVLITVVGD